MKKPVIVFVIIFGIIAGAIYLYFRYFKAVPPNPPQSPQNTASVMPTSSKSLAEPITQFKERITKKPFGIYITPQTSPVQPERFSGYHTGVDVEYQDVADDVPVFAISSGTIVLSKNASGYGGVLMLEFDLKGQKQTALYGHLRPSSLPEVGTKVAKGEQLAVLGTGSSPETDGERKHLHFAILSDNRIDIKGYVQSQSELSGWLDPLSLY